MNRLDTDTVLSVETLTKEFGGLVAVNGVDLEVREGEIVGLIGPNGAGKTTLFNCIMSTYTPTSGKVLHQGEDITGQITPEIVQRGIARTFQIVTVFSDLSIYDNMVAHQDHSDENIVATLWRKTDQETTNQIEELLNLVGLWEKKNEPASDLSTGQQKLLNLACTLLGDPDVVLLDEPTAGVNPALADEIIETITRLNESGHTFLLIEHDMNAVRRLADYLYVMDNGENLTEGEPESALNNPAVLEAYFGA